MNYKMTGRFIAQILLLEALFMIPGMLISLYCGENASVKAFLVTMVLLLVVSCLLRFLWGAQRATSTQRTAWSAWP